MLDLRMPLDISRYDVDAVILLQLQSQEFLFLMLRLLRNTVLLKRSQGTNYGVTYVTYVTEFHLVEDGRIAAPNFVPCHLQTQAVVAHEVVQVIGLTSRLVGDRRVDPAHFALQTALARALVDASSLYLMYNFPTCLRVIKCKTYLYTVRLWSDKRLLHNRRDLSSDCLRLIRNFVVRAELDIHGCHR